MVNRKSREKKKREKENTTRYGSWRGKVGDRKNKMRKAEKKKIRAAKSKSQAERRRMVINNGSSRAMYGCERSRSASDHISQGFAVSSEWILSGAMGVTGLHSVKHGC